MAFRVLQLEEQRKEERKGFSEEQQAKLDAKYPSKERFSLVERIVFGMTGLALAAVGTALFALVVHKSSGG